MQRRFRLTKDAEYRRVRSEGRFWTHPSLVLYALPNEAGISRVGISVGRGIGKAVARNRVKRLIREAIRVRLGSLKPGWDILLVARKSASGAGFREIGAAVDELLKRAGLILAAQDERGEG